MSGWIFSLTGGYGEPPCRTGNRHAFLYNPASNRWTATSDVPLAWFKLAETFKPSPQFPAAGYSSSAP